MNKRIVIEKIIAKLVSDLDLIRNAARAAHFEATHESSKAENKYDTRGLEAGYLAQGQMKHAKEIEESISDFQKLSAAKFNSDQPVSLGALVELDSKEGSRRYFIGPRAGGLSVDIKGEEIVVLTTQAPLGQILTGKKVGDRFRFGEGVYASDFKIESVI